MSGLDPDELARLRVVLARIARGLDRHSRGSDLTRTQVSVLGTVVVRGPIGMGELATIEGLNPTMLSRLAGKLETAGLLVRDADPDDGRAVRVAATEAGVDVHRRRREERARLLARLEEPAAALPKQLNAAEGQPAQGSAGRSSG